MRWIALETETQRAAVTHARTLVDGRDAHMGNPAHPLKRHLRRFNYAREKFGFTKAERRVSGRGLRRGDLNELYKDVTGEPPPVRGGGPVSAKLDRAARLAVSARAGRSRLRTVSACLGTILLKPRRERGAR